MINYFLLFGIKNHRDDLNKCNYFHLLYDLRSLPIPSVTSRISCGYPPSGLRIPGSDIDVHASVCQLVLLGFDGVKEAHSIRVG